IVSKCCRLYLGQRHADLSVATSCFRMKTNPKDLFTTLCAARK
ncbi:MAG: hypothetical protein EZS28_042139, partial [Streblomastix strix]